MPNADPTPPAPGAPEFETKREAEYIALKETADAAFEAVRASWGDAHDAYLGAVAACITHGSQTAFLAYARRLSPSPAPPAGSGEPGAWRPQVVAMANAMEAKLRKHDAKRGPRGWIGDNSLDLIARLHEEVREFVDALNPAVPYSPTGIIGEAADVANFAMMLADVTGAIHHAPSLPAHPGAAVREVTTEGMRTRVQKAWDDTSAYWPPEWICDPDMVERMLDNLTAALTPEGKTDA